MRSREAGLRVALCDTNRYGTASTGVHLVLVTRHRCGVLVPDIFAL